MAGPQREIAVDTFGRLAGPVDDEAGLSECLEDDARILIVGEVRQGQSGVDAVRQLSVACENQRCPAMAPLRGKHAIAVVSDDDRIAENEGRWQKALRGNRNVSVVTPLQVILLQLVGGTLKIEQTVLFVVV